MKKSQKKWPWFAICFILVGVIGMSTSIYFGTKDKAAEATDYIPPQSQVLFVASTYGIHVKTNVLEVPIDYKNSDRVDLCYVTDGGALVFYNLPSENIEVLEDPSYFGLPEATIGKNVDIRVSSETFDMLWQR